jgi:ATP-dependent Lhr-like helicase
VTPTERRLALTSDLLRRHGILTREAVATEGVEGGFASVYPVLKAYEEAGRIRRGYFVAGLGATQFAATGADEQLRALRNARPSKEKDVAIVLAATDPAQPYGSALPWPPAPGERLERRGGCQVILWRGELVAFVPRRDGEILAFLPDAEPERGHAAHAIAAALAEPVDRGRRRARLIETVNGQAVATSPLAPFLAAAGFRPGASGYLRGIDAMLLPRYVRRDEEPESGDAD